VNWSVPFVALVPLGVVTVMSTVPALFASEVATTWVAELTVNEAAALPPNWTEVAPVKLAPVIVTAVPPAVEPEDGLTAVTVGRTAARAMPGTASTATNAIRIAASRGRRDRANPVNAARHTAASANARLMGGYAAR
jgi:hypothetical protein